MNHSWLDTKLRVEGVILGCGAFFSMSLKLEKHWLWSFQPRWKERWSPQGSRVLLHLSLCQIAPSFPCYPGEMVNKDLEARAESQGTSQERNRLLEKGRRLRLQTQHFHGFSYVLFLVFLFSGVWVLQRLCVIKVKKCYSQSLVPSLDSFLLFILFLFPKEIQSFMRYFPLASVSGWSFLNY